MDLSGEGRRLGSPIDLGRDKLAKGTCQVHLTQNGTVVTKQVVVM